jgi:hypothetical protein
LNTCLTSVKPYSADRHENYRAAGHRRRPVPDAAPANPAGVTPIALPAARIVGNGGPFPGCFSLRGWRQLDAAAKTPRGHFVAGTRRKVWLYDDLRRWANLGFPDRREFEQRTNGEKPVLDGPGP